MCLQAGRGQCVSTGHARAHLPCIARQSRPACASHRRTYAPCGTAARLTRSRTPRLNLCVFACLRVCVFACLFCGAFCVALEQARTEAHSPVCDRCKGLDQLSKLRNTMPTITVGHRSSACRRPRPFWEAWMAGKPMLLGLAALTHHPCHGWGVDDGEGSLTKVKKAPGTSRQTPGWGILRCAGSYRTVGAGEPERGSDVHGIFRRAWSHGVGAGEQERGSNVHAAGGVPAQRQAV